MLLSVPSVAETLSHLLSNPAILDSYFVIWSLVVVPCHILLVFVASGIRAHCNNSF